jgi:hypothetical protein
VQFLTEFADVDTLFSLYSIHNKGSEKPSNDSIAQCLKDMLMTTGQAPIYLVIDALDKCPNDSGIPSPCERVLNLVKELVSFDFQNCICESQAVQSMIFTPCLSLWLVIRTLEKRCLRFLRPKKP